MSSVYSIMHISSLSVVTHPIYTTQYTRTYRTASTAQSYGQICMQKHFARLFFLRQDKLHKCHPCTLACLSHHWLSSTIRHILPFHPVYRRIPLLFFRLF